MHAAGLFRKLYIAVLALVYLLAPLSAQTPYRYLRAGNPSDANAKTQPGFALIGGGKDLDAAFQWLCQHSGGGDFLVLRATGSDAYNPYIQSLCRQNSVATLIIPNRAAASDPFVAETISKAEAIFIAGGDQANYIHFWKGTPVEQALNVAIEKGMLLAEPAQASPCRANTSTPRRTIRPKVQT